MTRAAADLTDLLDAWSQGDSSALVDLMDVAQGELREIAGHAFRDERIDHTLQPTAVVNELYLKLARQRKVQWHSRAEFFGVAAQLMRRILVDHARRHLAEKRGGETVPIALDNAVGLPVPDAIALDDALIDLERRSPRQSRVAEMRLLVGLTLEEIAAVLDVSPSTVSRDWKTVRLFLRSQWQP